METDFVLDFTGSIYLLTPLTPDAAAWVDENLSDAQRFGESIAIEHRYADYIADRIQDDCLLLTVN